MRLKLGALWADTTLMHGLFRSIQAQLGAWLRSPRRKPLIIRGARQVGKSTLVRQFAEAQERRLLEINLERHPRLEAVFASLDVRAILLELEAVGQVAPGPDTILFLDEIQTTPSAIAALRYLHEERPAVVSHALWHSHPSANGTVVESCGRPWNRGRGSFSPAS